MRRLILILICSLAVFASSFGEEAPAKPLMKDFMGINGHTVQFKPKLYQPVCRLVRDYHPIEWDFGNDTSYPTAFPLARNKVDWQEVYGSWKKSGYDIDVSALFETITDKKWKDPVKDAEAYGLAFAKYFGPSNHNLVSSFEIGNEPGKYDDGIYRKVFENMARGVRNGDPKMKILTCNCTAGKGHAYAKSVTIFEGLEDLFDVFNVHTYAEVKGWPTWERSYPEDPKIPYLKDVERVAEWRDAHGPKKEIWVTEFGWDASTKQPPKTGDFAKWQGSTETQQAQWLVRSFMIFAGMPVNRAYIYFFDDQDQPQVHGSSGLTRNFKPKPSYHAVAHLQKTLGEYRFDRIIEKKQDEVYAYQFVNGADPAKAIWAVWSPTGSDRHAETTLQLNGYVLDGKAEQMPLKEGEAAVVEIKEQNGSITVPVTESALYIPLKKK